MTRRFRQAKIEEILQTLVQKGGFSEAIVAASDGLLVAMVGTQEATLIAAVSAAIKDLIQRAHPGASEVVTRDETGKVIVSRYFSIDEDWLLLAIETPLYKPYRRLTTWAIKEIKHVWANPIDSN
jgi:predicted regulator of Ras-like GTPase activity (Roadblock/LC7/MglB family)